MVGSSGYQSPDNIKTGARWLHTSPRKFEYQSVEDANENRFEMIKLPEIYTKVKKEPCFDYDKSLKPKQPNDLRAQKEYNINYDAIEKKAKFFTFTSKKHSDLMKCEIEDNKKGKLWDRLLKRAEVEKAEEERKF